MKLENLKQEAPLMPDDMREVVEQQVARQLDNSSKKENRFGRQGKMSRKKIMLVALAATMLVGTTAFAAERYYQFRMEKEGQYGLKTGVVVTGDTPSEQKDTVLSEIPTLKIKPGYLPEGMVTSDDGEAKYYFASTPYQGGISINTIAMDEKPSAKSLPLSDKYVTKAEDIKLGDHQAIYLEQQMTTTDGIGFDKKIYVVYPEYWQIAEIAVGSDVTKEEALKIAEKLQLTPTGETTPLSETVTWSAMLADQMEQNEGAKLVATSEEMSKVHKVGDTFALPMFADTDAENGVAIGDIAVSVTAVQVADDNRLLNEAYMEDDLQTAFDANGKLLPNEITYIKTGDGVNSLDKTLSTETVNQKLVYATVNYTNTGDKELQNVPVFGSFVGITKEDKGYAFYDRAGKEKGADLVEHSSVGSFGEMDYYDVRGNGGKNYIDSIPPGETVTVHLAKVVNEDELNKMYLSLDPEGAAYEFSETALEIGYVEIAQ